MKEDSTKDFLEAQPLTRSWTYRSEKARGESCRGRASLHRQGKTGSEPRRLMAAPHAEGKSSAEIYLGGKNIE